VHPGASLVLCFCTRICLTEIVYFLLQRQPLKAQRRWRTTIAQIGGRSMPVYYPTVSRLRKAFSPAFALRESRGVGVAIPPSYLESLVSVRPRLFRILCFLERLLAPLPILRTIGDHIVLRFEKIA
jgi:hypothetical protein